MITIFSIAYMGYEAFEELGIYYRNELLSTFCVTTDLVQYLSLQRKVIGC